MMTITMMINHNGDYNDTITDNNGDSVDNNDRRKLEQ